MIYPNIRTNMNRYPIAHKRWMRAKNPPVFVNLLNDRFYWNVRLDELEPEQITQVWVEVLEAHANG